MSFNRGDVASAVFPLATGTSAKIRLVLIVQANSYNDRLHNILVAEITSNTTRATAPALMLVDILTQDGIKSGLPRNSMVSCLNLANLHESRIESIIRQFSNNLMSQVDECLKVALGLS